MLIPILSFFLLSFAILLPRTKVSFSFLFIFMAAVMCLNTFNLVDWNAYEFLYEVISITGNLLLTDIGYGALNFLASTFFSWDFFVFRMVFTFLFLLILGKTILKHSPYPSLVLALYFVAPFFPNDIIQIRNFAAEVTLFYFLSKWISSGRKQWIMLFLGICLGALLHSSIWFFAILGLIIFVKDNRLLTLITFWMSLGVGILPLLLRMLPFISADKISFYLAGSGQGFDSRSVIISLVILIQFWISHIIMTKSESSLDSYYQNWVQIVYRMNLITLASIPIIMMWSFNFYRVPRNLLLYNYVSLSLYIYDKKEKSFINFYTLVYIVLGLIWSILNSFSQWEVIWSNNWLIKW